MKVLFQRIKEWLKGLSFTTGLIVLGICVVCYIISFAQFALPIGYGWKSALWVIFFGLAKTCQYAGILIIGKEGVMRLKNWYRRRKAIDPAD